ncbi:MAG: toprim domain-containing protein, partial [Alphaproteobacteria bacterium]
MARIPDAEIERLKSETSLLRLVESSGLILTKQGKDHVGLCPFHEEDTPSFRVSEDKNLFNCFGCGAGGGVIDWVMKKNGVSFRHAVELLREGVSDVAETPVKRTTVRALPPPVTLDAEDNKLLGQVVDYYHSRLKQSPEALEYLKARGLHNAELIDTFKLGLADRSLGLRLPEKNRKEGAAIRARLEKIGIYRESGHEHFNGSLVVPVLGPHGEVQEIYGRKLLNNLRKGTPLHLYLPGPHKGLWNVQALTASKEIILCEALLDAATFWCAGFRNVTAAYGVEGFTEEMLSEFKKHGIERVLIAFDRDEAGDRGAAKVAAQLMEAGIECWRILFPQGVDANEYALKVQPANKSLGALIRKAEWLGKGAAPARAVQEPELTMVEAAPPPPEATKEESEKPLSSLAATNPAPSVMPAPMQATPAAETTLPASPVPPAPRCDLDAAVNEREVVLTFEARRWRIRGLPK